MSKKLSKVLVVAVVLVLSMSLFALVACGGPDPLAQDGAYATLQSNFKAAPVKTVVEKVNISGIDVKIAAIAELKIDNVDVELTRKYTADGKLNLKAVVSNLKVSMPKGFTTISGFIKDVAKNLDETVISNFSKVVLEAEITLMNPANCDPDDESSYEDYLVLNNFVIKNLDQVVDAKGEQWAILANGAGELLGSEYKPGEMFEGGKDHINPRHNKDTENPDGIFAAMDKWASKKIDDMGAGSILEQFIIDNYQMLSAYDFNAMTVNNDTISYTGKSDLSKVYAVGDKILNCYADNKLDKKAGGQITISELIKTAFGSKKNVKGIVENITDLASSEVTMSGKIVAVDDKWQMSELHTNQTVKVTLSGTLLSNAVNKIMPIFADVDLSDYKAFIDPALADGLTTNVTAKVDATFTYGA